MLKMHNNDLNNSASSVYVTNRLNQYTDLSNLVQSCNPVYDHDGNMLTNVSHDLDETTAYRNMAGNLGSGALGDRARKTSQNGSPQEGRALRAHRCK